MNLHRHSVKQVTIRTRPVGQGFRCVGQIVADDGRVIAETRIFPHGCESRALSAAQVMASMRGLAVISLPPSLHVVHYRGTLGLRDPAGGIWWPTTATDDEVELARAYASGTGAMTSGLEVSS